MPRLWNKHMKKLQGRCKTSLHYKDSKTQVAYTSAGTKSASGSTTNRRTQNIGLREFAWRGDPRVLLTAIPMNA